MNLSTTIFHPIYKQLTVHVAIENGDVKLSSITNCRGLEMHGTFKRKKHFNGRYFTDHELEQIKNCVKDLAHVQEI